MRTNNAMTSRISRPPSPRAAGQCRRPPGRDGARTYRLDAAQRECESRAPRRRWLVCGAPYGIGRKAGAVIGIRGHAFPAAHTDEWRKLLALPKRIRFFAIALVRRPIRNGFNQEAPLRQIAHAIGFC